MNNALKKLGRLSKLALLTTTATIVAIGTIGAASAKAENCPGNSKALGVGRTIEIDTTGGPGFGLQQYRAYDFLKKGEVVLTFDDGPLPGPTRRILKALRNHCTKAIFFPVGKLAAGYPEVLREAIKDGHTIGSHTFNHLDLKKNAKKAVAQIESGFSTVKVAMGQPGAPFFRFPYLRDSKETIKYLGKRNIAVFSMDFDSYDFKIRSPKKLLKRVKRKLNEKGKGILLMHDINKTTAKTLPAILEYLQKEGYTIVHLKAKSPIETIAQYDTAAKKKVMGLDATAGNRPMSSIMRTVE